MQENSAASPRIVGRYALYDEIAAGGMAAVHLGRLLGPAGFSRTVAIKRLHPQFAKDPEFVSMFLDEARVTARIRHPNVVSTLDVIALEGELLVVMDYVQGESLSWLLRATRQSGAVIPRRVVAAVMVQVLTGLHAAHEATGERGERLDIVHRDVSPQNVLAGTDGIVRVADFGVAKAVGRLQVTREGTIKGKVPYMAPEQIRDEPIDCRSDVYAASVVLWEALAGRRLFEGNDATLMYRVLQGVAEPPSKFGSMIPSSLDRIVMKGLSLKPENRFATAREMADALERAVSPATNREVGRWVEDAAAAVLAARAAKVKEVESSSAMIVPALVEPKVSAPSPEPPAPAPSLTPPESDHNTLSTGSVLLRGSVPPKPSRSPVLWAVGVTAVAIAIPSAILIALRSPSALSTQASSSVRPSGAADRSIAAPPRDALPWPNASALASSSVSAVASASGSAPPPVRQAPAAIGTKKPSGPGATPTNSKPPGSKTDDDFGF